MKEYDIVSLPDGRTGHIIEIFKNGDVLVEFETPEGPDQYVSYPAYIFRDTGEVEEVYPLTKEWFDLIDLAPADDEDEEGEEE